MNRKCRQNVATDDRRTFTGASYKTLGNDNKDAMLDCESGSHQSEDKRKLEVLANEDTFFADTVLLMMFLGPLRKLGNICCGHKMFLNKLGNICCGHKMFLNKIRNIFCVPDTQICCARANGETFVSATMCPQQCVLVCQGL